MALQLSMPQPSGAVATYHKITTGIVDFVSGKTTLNIESYLDAQARADGKAALAGSSLTVDVLPSFNGDPRPWAYQQFKDRPEWAGATDV